MTWFNPPYNQQVSTNIGKRFFKLLDKSFPPGHTLPKLLNRNTVKLSYSCTPNISQHISAHNKLTLNQHAGAHTPQHGGCNCRAGVNSCPLDGKCQERSIVYQAMVARTDNNANAPETYIGLTENTFKNRYSSHLNSFNHSKHRNATSLSQHVWYLRDQGIPYTIKWKIISKAPAYKPELKHCNLCLTEKYFIICHSHLGTLNSRKELLNTCRHRKKFLLCNQT